MKKFLKPALLVTALLFSLNAAAELKIAYIEMAQVMQSQQAQDIGKKLQTEFSSRATQLDQLKKTINDKRTALDKDSKKLSEADLRDKSKQISDLTIDFERKQRELNEDVNIRKNEEMGKFQQQLNKAVNAIAQTDGYDLIVYNSVAYASKKINITDKVISALGK
jgi:outer membrane protein